MNNTQQNIEILKSTIVKNDQSLNREKITVNVSLVNIIFTVVFIGLLLMYLLFSKYYVLSVIVLIVLCLYIYVIRRKKIVLDSEYLIIQDAFSLSKIPTREIDKFIIITYSETTKSIIKKESHGIIVQKLNQQEHFINTDDFNQSKIISNFNI